MLKYTSLFNIINKILFLPSNRSLSFLHLGLTKKYILFSSEESWGRFHKAFLAFETPISVFKTPIYWRLNNYFFLHLKTPRINAGV